MGVVARDCRGEILGAQCGFKSIVVDAKTAEAMAALWAVLFIKAEGFLDAIFEGDSAQVVAEISYSPPYLIEKWPIYRKHKPGNQRIPDGQFCPCSPRMQ
jgi:ribonuclease HI